MSEPVLSVSHLRVAYPTPARPLRRRGAMVAVDDVSLEVHPGETVAVVGESGSGKSTIGNAVLGLAPVTSGTLTFGGRDISHTTTRVRRELASDLQAIFQNPYGSLNPSLTVEAIMAEPIRLHTGMSGAESRARVRELLAKVGLPADAADRYPHSFSGGQRQRIAIARALALAPRLIICDEPTSALDVSTQKVVLDLLTALQQESNVAYLFITHDLAVVREFADRVVVLNRGRIVEQGDPADVCDNPRDPYTQRLVAAAPVPDPRIQAERRAARHAAVRQTSPAHPVSLSGK